MQGKPNPKIKHLVKFEFHSSQYRITMEGSAQPDGSGGGWGGRKGQIINISLTHLDT